MLGKLMVTLLSRVLFLCCLQTTGSPGLNGIANGDPVISELNRQAQIISKMAANQEQLSSRLEQTDTSMNSLSEALQQHTQYVHRMIADQDEANARAARVDKLLTDLSALQQQSSQLLAMTTTRDDQEVRLNSLQRDLEETVAHHYGNMCGRLEESASSLRNVMLRMNALASRQDQLQESQQACTNASIEVSSQTQLICTSQQISTARLNEMAATNQRTIISLRQLMGKVDALLGADPAMTNAQVIEYPACYFTILICCYCLLRSMLVHSFCPRLLG